MTTKKQKVILLKYGELFCGPGGLALGATRSKIRNDGTAYTISHQWANDYDSDSCKTYQKNIASQHPASVICQNVHELAIDSLKKIDAFAYGFPCNDFSIVGEQKGFHGKFGPLYLHGIRIINKFKPIFFVAENVSGITSANDGKAFKTIISDLSRSGNGYALTAHLYKAEDYGVPQTRHRVIIVGIDKTTGKIFNVPAPTHKGKPKTAKEALENPPIPAGAFNNEIRKQSPAITERLKLIKPGENVWTAKLPPKLRLNVKSARMSQIYKRLHPDKPAYTMTGSGGGGTHGYHYKDPRALTNRERARIQTFPDSFKFEGSPESVRKQIGMAVPPLLAQTIFTAILKTLAGVPYQSISANINHDNQLKIL